MITGVFNGFTVNTIFNLYYSILESPLFTALCGAKQTRSVALARYPLAIPFRPHTDEKQYKKQVILKSLFLVEVQCF